MAQLKKKHLRRRNQLQPNQVISFNIGDDLFKKDFAIYIGNMGSVKKKLTRTYPGVDWSTTFEEGYAGLVTQIKDMETAGTIYVVWLESVNYDTLVHECFHVIYDALKVDGITLSEPTNEVFAYYLGWLFKQIRTNISRRGF